MTGTDTWTCTRHHIAVYDARYCHLCSKKIEAGDAVTIQASQDCLEILTKDLSPIEVRRFFIRNGGRVTLADGALWEDAGGFLRD